jgi:hypothetical protein
VLDITHNFAGQPKQDGAQRIGIRQDKDEHGAVLQQPQQAAKWRQWQAHFLLLVGGDNMGGGAGSID